MKDNHREILEYYAKIRFLKDKLRATDYKAIKFAEGEIAYSDYVPIREERRKIRNEINELEEMIHKLKGEE